MTASPQQLKLHDFLAERESRGMPSPSLREICVAMGFRSTNAASDLVQKLEDSGAIRRKASRCWEIFRLAIRTP
jgi:SOS-response transcriptional repressor LexA